MHQSQKTTMIHKCCAGTSRPHHLKKTYSKQSKRRDLHLVTLSWDNRSNLIYIINIKTLMLLLFYKNKQTMNLKLLSGAWEGSARKTESKVHERNQVRHSFYWKFWPFPHSVKHSQTTFLNIVIFLFP